MGSSRFSCVLWDVDGTIADASAGILPRIEIVLGELGKPSIPADQVNRWIGPPMLESFQLLAGLSLDDATKAVARYRELASLQGYANSVRLYDGVVDVIREVHAAGVPQTTASTKPGNQIDAIFEHFELTELFVAVHGATPTAAVNDTKTDVLRRALDDMRSRGVDISRPVLIGDRHHDIDGAAELGEGYPEVPVIFARWGFGSAEEEAGALTAVDTPAALRDALLG